MRTGSLLRLQGTEGLEPLGAFNQAVYKSYGQIRAALLNELGPRYADYFARPDYDSDGNRIGWLAHEIGEPVRWVDMDPEEQIRLDAVKGEIERGFTAYIARMGASADNSPQSNFAKLLSQALQVPGPDCLYFLGDQPVLAFWGFKQAGEQAGIEPLRLRPGVMVLPGTAPPGEHGAVVPPASTARRWRWLWALLALLILLLLLFGLWFWFTRGGLRHQLSDLPFMPPAEVTKREGTVPADPVSPPIPDCCGTRIPHGPQPAVTEEGRRSGDAGQPDTGTVVPPILQPDGRTGTVPYDTRPDDKHVTPPLVPDPGPGPGRDDRPDGQTLVTPPGHDAETIPSDLAELPPSGGPSGPSKPFELKPGARPGPASFMEGVWRSRSGLVVDGKPAEEYYRFDKTGRGDVTVRTRDGSKTCHGAAQSVVGPDGHLAVHEAPNLACNDGKNLAGVSMDCAPGDGRSRCLATNPADQSKFGVQLDAPTR